MNALKCDVCNGTLVMDSSKEIAVCNLCGITYPIQDLKRKVQETQANTITDNWRKLLPLYIKNRDWDSAQSTINKILEQNPDDENMLLIQENLQDWKRFQFQASLDMITAYKADDGLIYDRYMGKTANIIVPDGVKQIPVEFFWFCQCVQSVTFPDTIEWIGEKAFNYCSNLSQLSFGENLKHILSSAFEGCEKLTSIKFNEKLCSIGEFAFSGTALQEIVIPETVYKIGNDAFANTPLAKVIMTDELKKKIDVLSVFRNTPYLMKEYPDLVCKDRRDRKKCQHCGGDFKGMLKKKCINCGKEKDY